MRLGYLMKGLAVGALLAVLSACSSSTSAVDESESNKKTQANAEQKATTTAETTGEQAAEAEDQSETQLSKVIKKEGKVANRGVYIKLLVNKNPITNFDINRRVAFLKLRRVSGNRAKIAEQEMIEQILKLQEAKRRNVLVNDKAVNDAYASFAKRNRSTTAQLSRAMNQYGVGVDHFKAYIRTQMSWQRAVSGRFQAETSRVSEQDAVIKLRDSGSEKPEVTEYNFQQVVFVVPSAQRTKSKLAARRVEANAFRQRFTSCGETINLAKTLKDVSVIERKRILEPELPETWKDEIKNVDSKGTTRAKETNKGVEFIAICNSKTVSDDRAAQVSTQSAEFESFNKKGSELDKRYLDELKSRATIIYQ